MIFLEGGSPTLSELILTSIPPEFIKTVDVTNTNI